jgi:hypothetical protein
VTSGNGTAPTRRRLVAVAQARSSGATTAALVLGLCWPRPAVLAELDPAGGVLAARFGLAPNPGLLTLAASGPHSTAADVHAHTQPLGALPAVVGPIGAEAAAAALGQLLPEFGDVLAALDGDVIADCGRLGPGSVQVAPILSAASLVLLVARPSADGVADLRHRLAILPEKVRSRAVVLLVGSKPYPPAEVAAVLDVEVAGTLARDPGAADLLASGVTGGLRLGRSALWRSARSVVDALACRLDQSAPAPPADRAARLAPWSP